MPSSVQRGATDSPARTSRSLLDGLKRRDNESWSALVDLYTPLVYHWCRKSNLAEQDVADIVQEVFRSVVSTIGTFRKVRPTDTFRGWLRTITRNKLTDHFRRLKQNPAGVGGSDAQRRIEQVADEQPDDDDEERTVEQTLFHRALERIRQHFEPATWQAFWRVVVDGLSTAEAAAELGMRPGTVRVAKSRILQRLRRQLGDLE